jgi:hypothetical protein
MRIKKNTWGTIIEGLLILLIFYMIYIDYIAV